MDWAFMLGRGWKEACPSVFEENLKLLENGCSFSKDKLVFLISNTFQDGIIPAGEIILLLDCI